MTEKIASLSGGLVLGMAFTLFLSISSTQTLTAPLHMGYPSMSDLISINDFQSYHTSSASSTDTTPAISVSTPSTGQDQGRIIRIATSTETSDPVLSADNTPPQESILPKTWTFTEAPKTGSPLQQMHLQHTFIAGASTGNNFCTIGQAARQTSNFTAIADNSSGDGQSSGGSGQPPVIDNKPQTTGSPAIAQGNPGTEEGEEEGGSGGPAMASFTPRPPTPDSLNDNGARHSVNPYSPHPEINDHETGEDSNNDDHHGQGGPSQLQNSHRPETD